MKRSFSNDHFCELLSIRYPLIQAGMAGGPTTPELVAAVSNAGGLGTLGASYLTPVQMRNAIRSIRSLTSKPFAINLFIPESFEVTSEQIHAIQVRMKPYRDELGIQSAPEPHQFREDFSEQISVILEEQVPVLSFTFGIPSPELIEKLKNRNIYLIGTATNVREAKRLEAMGIDAIVAQGSEAGGHRGTFIGDSPHSLIGIMALVPQIVDAVQLPVVASGGIMDGRGIAAAFTLGACAVQLGTAFLTCEESGAHPAHQEAIRNSTDESTQITTAFSGKPARGIENRFMREMNAEKGLIPPYPVQNTLTRDIRQAASKQNQSEFLSMWAGQASPLFRTLPARDLIEALMQETEEVVDKLKRITFN